MQDVIMERLRICWLTYMDTMMLFNYFPFRSIQNGNEIQGITLIRSL